MLLIVREEPGPYTDEQIQLVQTFADQAAITIANARLSSAVERQRTELSRFVSPQVAGSYPASEVSSSSPGTVCTSPASSATSAASRPSRRRPPRGAPRARSRILVIGELLPSYDGTLEHFAGDGLMVFFNDPVPVDDHELKAVRMALAVQERFRILADTWRKRGSDLGLGVGIASGYATLGRIGFEGRYDYGAVGPVVNLAARLSTHAAMGQTLMSQRALAEIEDVVDAAPVGEIELKGFGRPVPAYEIRGLL